MRPISLSVIAVMKPALKPKCPNFSSGPAAKRPGWTPDVLCGALLGRSHRSAEGRARLRRVIEKTKAVLALPADYRVAIVPGSDTGAMELALWNLLGPRGVDVLAWEAFGRLWVSDVLQELRIADVRVHDAEAGRLPDLSKVDFARDVIFTWNGTTSGVRVPDGNWIAGDRQGLTICDATSAAFAQRIDWAKIDVATFSWQKVLGGEAQHGILVMAPRAIERLKAHTPAWPVPKLFRMKKDSRLIEDVFDGFTINTPSMLAVEDFLDALGWAERIGGFDALCQRADANAKVVFDWIADSAWIENLSRDAMTRSNTSVCLRFKDPRVRARGPECERDFAQTIAGRLATEGVAFDILSHRDAPPGLRLWTGATVETSDLEALTIWLDWAFETAFQELLKAA